VRSFALVVIILAVASWGAWAKSGPTFHTRDQIERARELCRTAEWAMKLREDAVQGAARWAAMSDEDLWDFILDADIPRALNVRFGFDCPIHGKEIFAKGGHYPWIMSTDEPFKVKCPVGGEVYPTNDFAAYLKGGREEKLDTTQQYVDDGYGWVDAEGNHYWFVAHYIFWQRWRRDVLDAISSLSGAYELTGDPKYAHKTGVMLGRLVQVYPKMDYAKQAYHNGKWPAGIDGRILDYIWENSVINRFAQAYDAVYDGLDTDADLKQFLSDRGIAGLKRDFEQQVLHFMARDIMAGRIRGNMYYQPTLARLAIILDNNDPAYGPTTKEMVDWLLYGGGEINLILYNGFDRDGVGGESAPGYSSAWNENFCAVADLLIRLGVDVTSDPRWRQILRFPYNVTLAGQFSPRLGDCSGDIHSAPKLVNPTVLRFGFKHFKDVQCAQLLLDRDVFGNSLWSETLDKAAVEAVAKSAPDRTSLGTRDMGGYGLGVFETGEGRRRRAAMMYYGGADAWHGHHDRLTVDYWAHGRDFLAEMGYPSHWNDLGERFVRGMPSHCIVEIDERRSVNKKAGYLDFFVAGSRVRVMSAHGEAVYPGMADVYRRLFAMIDVGDESFLVDLFHVRGGQLHDYHFHGLPFGEFTTPGLTHVSTQEKGTLLGENVEWGGDTTPNASGYDFFRNVRRYRAEGVWSARWVGREDCRLSYWMPAYPEVVVCDGEPPSKPDYPKTMEFVAARDRAAESLFPAVIAPSQGRDIVTNVSFQRDGDAVHYTVDTPEGTWRIVADAAGAFSAECTRPDGAAYAFYANQRDVKVGGKEIRVKRLPRFTIKRADYATNTVCVKERIRKPEWLAGQVAVISGHGHSASYTVVQADDHLLRFDGPAITGMVVAESTEGKTLTTKTRLSGYGTQITARHLNSMALVSEDYRQAATVLSYTSDKDGVHFELTGPLECPDVNGDGRRCAYFADFAPGYTVTFSPWIEVESAPGVSPAVRSNVPAEIAQLRKPVP
jgi:hypothetical protein